MKTRQSHVKKNWFPLHFEVFPVGFPYYLQKAKSPYRREIPLRVAALNGSHLLNMLLGQRVDAGSHNATRGFKFFLFRKWHDIIARWKDTLYRKKNNSPVSSMP